MVAKHDGDGSFQTEAELTLFLCICTKEIAET